MRAALLAISLTALAAAVAAPALAMTLTSADLKDGQPMPAQHIYPRCGGKNVSPQLAWAGAPAATRSFIVTMIDHNVPPNDWSHWILVNLPPTVTTLPQGLKAPPAPARNVTTDFGDAAYGGPCPPAGTGVHHYAITVWAMTTPATPIAAGGTAKALEAALARASLAHATLTVTAQTR